MKLKFLVKIIPIVFCFTIAKADIATLRNPDVQTFIQEMVNKKGFNQQYLEKLFTHVTLVPPTPVSIIPSSKPPVAMTWPQYRDKYLTLERVTAGIAFWKAHQKTLLLAQQEYGVPPSIIIGILGGETNFGTTQGTFPVLNTLANLAFIDGHRERFFRKELVALLILCRNNHFNILTLKGSYAGAIGATQFMPSTYSRYAVSAVSTLAPDLFNNRDDAILSVAYYLKQSGWRAGMPVIIPVDLTQHPLNNWLPQETFKPVYSPQDISHFSTIKPHQFLSDKMMLRFIHLQGGPKDEYWLGTQNFYAITRYNNSTYYAMAIYELGLAVERAVNTSMQKQR
jgi:membrane-bound lytic murein transglycosylase B